MHKKIFLFLIIFFVLSVLFNCSKKSNSKDLHDVQFNASNETELLNKIKIQFTQKEKQYIAKLQNKGVLKAAGTLSRQDSQSPIMDFEYNLAKSFADYLNLKFEFVNVVEFEKYFLRPGFSTEAAQKDSTISYTPALLEEVDFYASTITILPWREQLMRFIKTIPANILILNRKGSEVQSIKEMDQQKLITVRHTNQEKLAIELEKQHKIQFQFIYKDDFDAVFMALINREGDYILIDSNFAVKAVSSNKNFSISIPVSEIQWQGWVVKKDNLILASIIEKYLKYAGETGIMNQHWQNAYGISINQYLKLLYYK
jgi:membrane-bound lytic murein transglycosylase MltF